MKPTQRYKNLADLFLDARTISSPWLKRFINNNQTFIIYVFLRIK